MGERIRLECGLFGSFCRDGGQEGLRSPVLGFRLGSGGVGGGGRRRDAEVVEKDEASRDWSRAWGNRWKETKKELGAILRRKFWV